MSFQVLNIKTHVFCGAVHHRKYSRAFLVAHIIKNCKSKTRRERQRIDWRCAVSISNGAVKMSTERASDLARHCTELVRKGDNFTTVWSTLLKGHTLVEGIPRELSERNRHLLRVPLVTGEQLVFDADVKEFRVQ
jgi:hypothetical protein